jgi:hypothetical protein
LKILAVLSLKLPILYQFESIPYFIGKSFPWLHSSSSNIMSFPQRRLTAILREHHQHQISIKSKGSGEF